MIKTASEFFALACLKRDKVEVRGQVVHIRELSVAERGRVLEIGEKSRADLPAFLDATCAVTPDGAPLFTAEQAAEIAKAAPEVVDSVAAAIMRLSGLIEADPKNA